MTYKRRVYEVHLVATLESGLNNSRYQKKNVETFLQISSNS